MHKFRWMSHYARAEVGRLFCVQWRDTPCVEDLKELSAEISTASLRLKQQVVYLTLIHPDEGAPPEDVQEALFEFFSEMQQFCDSMHLVILGKGFRQTVVRSVVTTGMLLSGLPKFIVMHEDVPSALEDVAARVGSSPNVLDAKLRERGIQL
ncbi:MAG: hypothetical protein ACT4TC_09240 [Myxococcaceae bacterium]